MIHFAARLLFTCSILLGIALFLSVRSPVYASTFTVTKTADTNDGTCDADCSLREAIVAANANIGADTIDFNIPTSDPGWNTGSFPNAFELPLSEPFITISDGNLHIDGTTQTTNTGDTNAAINEPASGGVVGNATRGPEIILNLQPAGAGDMITVDADTVKFEGLGFYNMANASGSVITVTGTATDFTALNDDFVDNAHGVITTTGQVTTITIQNSVFRDNATLSSGNDTITTSFTNSLIDNNEFVHNGSHAINATQNYGSPATTVISNNLFKDNGFLSGMTALDFSTNEVITFQSNTVTDNSNESLVISGASSSVHVESSLLYNNVTTSIDLVGGAEANFLTANDAGDGDTGPNNLMNTPVITSIQYIGLSNYLVSGSMDGVSGEAPFTIELCLSDNNSSGAGGCQRSLGQFTVATGAWSTTVNISGDNGTQSHSFSALATNASNQTSEFSPNVSYGSSTNSSTSSDSSSSSGPPGCSDAFPTSAPDLYEVHASGKSVTLRFAPAQDPVSDYFISYGYGDGIDRFGVTFPYGPSTGSIDYTVGNLMQKTKYFFKVRAQNGCAAGDWSKPLTITTDSLRTSLGGLIYYEYFKGLANVKRVFKW